MYKIKNKILIILSLVILFIPTIDTKAFFLITDIKVAPEIGIGANFEMFVPEKKLKDNKWLTKEKIDEFKIKAKTNFPFTIGLMVGYKFWFVEPEIGIKYHGKKKFELTNLFLFEENQIEIPLRINLHLSIIPSILGLKLIGGYKFNITSSTKFKVLAKDTVKKVFTDNKKILDSIDDLSASEKFPSKCGDIILGAGCTFPFGIYLNLLLNLPTDLLNYKDLKNKFNNLEAKKIDPREAGFSTIARLSTATFVELQLGFNLMKVIF
ncbi:MAG: hypothetical protein GY830_06365 [Bacteroidetes bacterium]|nr:hypothetical protein [Bacteroidota bacterium]